MSNPFAAFARPGVSSPIVSENRNTNKKNRPTDCRPRSAVVRRLGGEDAHRVRVGQLVLDASAVVKELVENALDANATRISVRVSGAGACDKIEVVDNGIGVEENDWTGMCRLGVTSKGANWEGKSNTFGFRGEALGGICGLAGRVVITTKTGEMSSGVKLVFGESGELIEKGEIGRTAGTTVTVENLFERYPVRKTDAEKNSGREIAKIVTVVSAFAVGTVRARIELRVDRRIKVITTAFLSEDDLSDKTKVSHMFKQNIGSVLGSKNAKSLMPCDKEDLFGNNSGYSVRGFVSQPRLFLPGRPASSHFFYINERPVDFPRLSRAINEVYRGHSPGASTPTAVLRFQVPVEACDANLSPDKRQVALEKEDEIVHAVQEHCDQLWMQQPTETIPVQSLPSLLPHQQNLKQKRQQTVSDDHGAGEQPTTDTLTQLYSLRKRVKCDEPKMTSNDGSAARLEAKAGCKKPAYEMGQKVKDLDVATFHRRTNVPGSLSLKPNRPSPNTVPKKSACTEESITTEEGMSRNSFDKERKRKDAVMEPVDLEIEPRPTQITVSDDVVLTEDPPCSFAVSEDQNSDTISSADEQKSHWEEVSELQHTDRIYDELTGDTSSDNNDRSAEHLNTTGKERAGVAGGTSLKTNTASGYRGPCPGESERVSEAHLNRGTLQDPSSALDIPKETGSQTTAVLDEFSNEVDFIEAQKPTKRKLSSAARPQRMGRAVLNLNSSTQRDGNEKDDAGTHNFVVMLGQPRSTQYSRTDTDKCKPRHTVEIPKKVQFDLGRVLQSARQRKQRSKRACTVLATSENMDEAQLRFADSSLLPKDAADITKDIAHESETQRVAAEKELSRAFRQEWFKDMRIIGQFNLGFIVCALGKNLFIVDQHASDEKFNFELLQRTTALQTQRLVHPKRLEFPAEEELLLAENLSALKAGGFEISYDPDKPPTERMQLLTVPFSKNIVFGVHDVQEIVSNLKSNQLYSRNVEVLRPRRVRDMFASRSCRMSVMIGTALDKAQMKRIVSHLSGLDHPWTCPHGRPTMRHLCDLGELKTHYAG